jgi:hypothetical protein
MKDETKERWQRLCEQASVEQDPAKLLKLVTEINDLLEQKRLRLNMPGVIHGDTDESSAQNR